MLERELPKLHVTVIMNISLAPLTAVTFGMNVRTHPLRGLAHNVLRRSLSVWCDVHQLNN
jgi:hypothetical protein